MEHTTIVRKAFNKWQREGLLSVSYALYRYTRSSFFDYFGDFLFKYLTILRYRKQKYIYNAPAHPYKVIYVNTNEIEYFNKTIDPDWGLGVIKDGKWDAPDNCIPIHATTYYRGFKQHFEKGIDWENTVYYQKKLRGQSHKDKRLEYVENLFNDIKQNGYRPNYKYGHDTPEGEQRSRQYIHALEPIVTIGREGDIYLNDGFHRLAIVKLLEIEEIPVNILARHRQWQEIREEIYESPNPNDDHELRKYTSHPDIEDIVRGQE